MRPPQRQSLEILDRITEIVPPRKGVDLQAALEAIHSEFPTVTDFEREFPYSIIRWDEAYTDVGGKRLTTKAERTKSILIDYWKRHKNSDRALREELDLPTDH